MSKADLSYFLRSNFTELTLGLENGLVCTRARTAWARAVPHRSAQRIAVKQWGPEHATTRILCLHGWLDK